MRFPHTIALLLTLFLAAGCGDDGTSPDGGPGGSDGGATDATLIFARGADSEKLDPHDITDGESVKVCVNIYDTLVEYTDDGVDVQPALATEWTVSDDGLTWTFDIREDVTFHDGTPCDADAVALNFLRQMDADHPLHVGTFDYWKSMFDAVADVSVTEDNGAGKVVFTLSEPHAPFLRSLAMFSAGIVAPSALETRQAGNELVPICTDAPVGTGPFRFVEWDKGERIVLERNDDWWGGTAGVKRVVFKVIPDNSARLRNLRDGRIHMMDGVNPGEIEAIEDDDALRLITRPGMNFGYLSFNHTVEPFDDPKVRRALALTVDKAAVAEHLYYGHAIPAPHPMPPMLMGWYDADPLGPDLERARSLLAEAGFPDGFESEIWYMTNPRPYMPEPEKTALHLKDRFAQIGVTIEARPFEWTDYLQRTKSGEHPMCLLGWTGDNGDPDNFLYVLLDKDNTTPGEATNVSFYRSDELHRVLRAAQTETDQDLRADLYRQALEIIRSDTPMVPLVHANAHTAVRENVRGYNQHPTGLVRLRTVTVD